MKIWYQIYCNGYWYTSTENKEEAYRIINNLKQKGHTVEIRVK